MCVVVLDREVFFLFAVYLDGLLVELSKSGVGCPWESSFPGAFSYVDDVVLLTPLESGWNVWMWLASGSG